jgi:hypothetical protein
MSLCFCDPWIDGMTNGGSGGQGPLDLVHAWRWEAGLVPDPKAIEHGGSCYRADDMALNR